MLGNYEVQQIKTNPGHRNPFLRRIPQITDIYQRLCAVCQDIFFCLTSFPVVMAGAEFLQAVPYLWLGMVTPLLRHNGSSIPTNKEILHP